MQQLRDMVAQLKADNERLRQERDEGQSSSGMTPSESNDRGVDMGPRSSSNGNTIVTERLIYVPRERKCPVFRGRTGIPLTDWLEEVKTSMRVRHLSILDKAHFLYDHLEGEAREEIKFRPREDREDPERVIQILTELYGCPDSYIVLQENFFSRRQLEGETLQEFSHALFGLMSKVLKNAPNGMPNSEVLLRDQFVEYVSDSALRRELKQFVRRNSGVTLLDVRGEAIRWEREGMMRGTRERSFSASATHGLQYGVQGSASMSVGSELVELKEMLKKQQEQLDQLTRTVSSLQNAPRNFHSTMSATNRGPVICRRCQQPGHFARECSSHSLPVRVNPSPSRPPQPAVQRSQPSVSLPEN